MPTGSDPAEWHRWIRAAPTFVAAQDRMEDAVAAGVDLTAMLRLP